MTTDAVHSAFYGRVADGKTFYHGHTYGGNPLGAAVALANLKVFDDEDTLERMRPKVDRLAGWLAELADHPLVGDVRQRGLIAGVELVADKESKRSFPWERQLGAEVCRRARGHGLFIRPLGDVIVIMPPLAISTEQLDEMLAIIGRSLDEVTP